MEANLAPAVSPALSMLIEDFLASCGARNLSINSIKLYRIALERFMEFYDGDLNGIDPRVLRRYIFDLQSAGLSSSTVHHYFRAIRTFCHFMVSEGFLTSSPASQVQMPKIGKRLPKVLSEAQAQALIDACPDWTWFGRRDKAAIFLLLGTGLRLAELLALDMYDMDLDAGFVTVLGKGDKERLVPLEDSVIEVLKGWLVLRSQVLGNEPQNALFISRHCGRMGKTFGQSVKGAGEKAGFYCTPHVLRHTMATDWIRGGGDLTRLRDILGHSHISITDIYVNLAQRDYKEAANQYSITRKLRFDSRQMSLL